jgi:hypothetical protein
MTLQSRIERLENKEPPRTLPPEQLHACIRELFLKRCIDPAEIATEEGFEAVCKRELLRLRGEMGWR